MATLRDGAGFFESGNAGESAPAGKRDLNFRTGDELPIGRPRSTAFFREPVLAPAPLPVAVPAPSFVSAASPSVHTLTIVGDGDLIAVSRALRHAGIQAWISVVTSQGPQSLELSQYLRSRGIE